MFKKHIFFSLLLSAIFFLLSCFPVWSLQTDDVRLQAILSQGPDQRPLSYPTAIFFDQEADEVYVVDTGNSQLVLFNRGGYPTDAVGRGRGLENIISGLRYEKKLYVCCGSSQDFPSGYINILNNAFFSEQLRVLEEALPQQKPFIVQRVMAGSNDTFYVLQNSNSGISVFDTRWNFLHQISPHYEHLGVREPAKIIDMTQDKNKNIYFLSEQWGRVFVYDKDETFLFSFGDKGGDTGKLARARGIAVDSSHDRIYIADYLRHTVLVYNLAGQWLYEIGGRGTRPGYFFYPSAVCVDNDRNLYVSDTFNHRVQIFSIHLREGD